MWTLYVYIYILSLILFLRIYPVKHPQRNPDCIVLDLFILVPMGRTGSLHEAYAMKCPIEVWASWLKRHDFMVQKCDMYDCDMGIWAKKLLI